MRRLTPDKLREMTVKLPDKALRIGNGNTSLVYTTDKPSRIQMFTVELAKLMWWEYNDLIPYYEQVGYALYEGNHSMTGEYKRMKLPVYMAIAKRVTFDLTLRRRRALRRALVEADKLWAKSVMPYNQTIETGRLLFWQSATHLPYTPIAEAAEFAYQGLDTYKIGPDMKLSNFAVYRDRVFALDFFAHTQTIAALRLYNPHEERRRW